MIELLSLRKGRWVWKRLEESLLLIVLLEEFLRESALLGGKIQFTVVTFATEILRQLLGDDMPPLPIWRPTFMINLQFIVYNFSLSLV